MIFTDQQLETLAANMLAAGERVEVDTQPNGTVRVDTGRRDTLTRDEANRLAEKLDTLADVCADLAALDGSTENSESAVRCTELAVDVRAVAERVWL